MSGVLRPQRIERIHFDELRTTFVFVSSDVVWSAQLHSQRPCRAEFYCLAKAGRHCQSANARDDEQRSGPELVHMQLTGQPNKDRNALADDG